MLFDCSRRLGEGSVDRTAVVTHCLITKVFRVEASDNFLSPVLHSMVVAPTPAAASNI